jgi:hypothetical protein
MKTETYRGRTTGTTLRALAATAGNVVERVSDVLADTRATVRGCLGLRDVVSLEDIEDWELAVAGRANVWLSGPRHMTRAALATISRTLVEPVVTVRAGAPLDFLLRSRPIGTLILEDASALRLDEQQRILAWLEDAGEDTRVISITSAHVFPLIETGDFLAVLYYRLNTAYVDLTGARKHSH